jgi:hypothetical protein
MGIADRRTKPDTRSKFEKWLESLSESNRATVLSWLADLTITNASVSDWIRDDDEDDQFVGYRADKDTVATWRRRNVPGYLS